jgi:8-amino-7-oxononanoate synthase
VADSLPDFLETKLSKRRADNLLRKLDTQKTLTDFSSNDYLGFAHSVEFYSFIKELEKKYSSLMFSGSGASRLISGNHALYDVAEKTAAQFHHGQAALIFNSGYDANIGLISSISTRVDTILYDEYCHASIRDGIRLSFAKSYAFKHNDLNDFKKKLGKTKGRVIAVIESVYSMDGIASGQSNPFWIQDFMDYCYNNGVEVIVDEAHGTGVFGKNGEGVISQCGLETRVFARVHTFGKALGVHGACVIGSEPLREYLVNFSRPFIYSTALPPHSILSIIAAYEFVLANHHYIENLTKNIEYFSTRFYSNPDFNKSAIHYKLVPGNQQCREMSLLCQKNSLDVRPILSPTVPAGKERLRICLHSFNNAAEMNKLLEITGNFTDNINE